MWHRTSGTQNNGLLYLQHLPGNAEKESGVLAYLSLLSDSCTKVPTYLVFLMYLQVDKHIPRCRDCWVLTCVDCSKDFEGEEFRKHTSCVTEAEKYQGKLYQAKKKKKNPQEQFLEAVETAASDTSVKPQLRKHLEQLRDFPNVPRKQKKFVNFCKNSFQVKDGKLMEEIWDVIQKHVQKNQPDAEDSAKSAEHHKDASAEAVASNSKASHNGDSQNNGHTNGVAGKKRSRDSDKSSQKDNSNKSSKKSETSTEETATPTKKQWKETIVELLKDESKDKKKGLKKKKLGKKALAKVQEKGIAASTLTDPSGDKNFVKALEKLQSKNKIVVENERVKLNRQ